jgi:hypothetical protein
MDYRRIGSEGVIAGLLGASAIAVWFLIVDAVAREPFFTPAMLGSALFFGLDDPVAVELAVAPVLAYSMVHVLSFVMVGLLASALACQAERSPPTLFLAVVLFAVFGFGFFTVWTILGPPILGALAWWSVAIGNGIAALVMGYYLWRRHPRLREQLAARPLGTTDDDTAGGIRAPE